jgi:hypothetical protein
MEQKDNPLLQNYNYWHPYQQSIEKLKETHPETVEFSKLAFDTFETPAGRQLMAMLEQNYLIPSMVRAGSPDYGTHSIYANGFKDGLLMLRDAVKQHHRRINETKEKKA